MDCVQKLLNEFLTINRRVNLFPSDDQYDMIKVLMMSKGDKFDGVLSS